MGDDAFKLPDLSTFEADTEKFLAVLAAADSYVTNYGTLIPGLASFAAAAKAIEPALVGAVALFKAHA